MNMPLGVRRALRTATALMFCSAAAVLWASPAHASRGDSAGWCSLGMLAYLPNGEAPVVTTPNATDLSAGWVNNTSPYNLTDLHAVLTVEPPTDSSIPGGAGAPTLQWRVSGGPWHNAALTWDGRSAFGAAWSTADLDLGVSLAQHAHTALDLETEFTSSSPGGQYTEQLTLTAQTCGSQILGFGATSADYEPTGSTATGPASNRPTPAATTAAPPAAHPSHSAPKPSPTPPGTSPAKPSPTPSELQVSFVQVLPSSQAVASTRTGDRIPDGVLVVVAVVFLGGLVGIRAVRRHKSS